MSPRIPIYKIRMIQEGNAKRILEVGTYAHSPEEAIVLTKQNKWTYLIKDETLFTESKINYEYKE